MKADSAGRSQDCRRTYLRAVALVQRTMAWCPFSASVPQTGQVAIGVMWCFCLLVWTANALRANFQAKILIFVVLEFSRLHKKCFCQPISFSHKFQKIWTPLRFYKPSDRENAIFLKIPSKDIFPLWLWVLMPRISSASWKRKVCLRVSFQPLGFWTIRSATLRTLEFCWTWNS